MEQAGADAETRRHGDAGILPLAVSPRPRVAASVCHPTARGGARLPVPRVEIIPVGVAVAIDVAVRPLLPGKMADFVSGSADSPQDIQLVGVAIPLARDAGPGIVGNKRVRVRRRYSWYSSEWVASWAIVDAYHVTL